VPHLPGRGLAQQQRWAAEVHFLDILWWWVRPVSPSDPQTNDRLGAT